MTEKNRNVSLVEQLKTALDLLDNPRPKWVIGAVLGSLAVAGLDMLGVASMIPLMQLIMGAPTDQGILVFFSSVFVTADRITLIGWVAGVVGVAFVGKTICVIGFRWWLLGHTNQLEVQASTELLRRYLSAPYWAHRRRNFGVINRAIGTGIGQTFAQVIGAILGLMVDFLTVLAIVAVLMLVSPIATITAIVSFFVITYGVQLLLKKHHRRIGETIADADLYSWMAFMPSIQGFRETRFSNSSSLWLERYKQAKNMRATATRRLSIISELPKYVLEISLVVVIGALAVILFTVSPNSAVEVLGVFAAASTRMLPALNRISANTAGIRAGRVGVEILVDELDELKEHGEFELERSGEAKFTGDIELSNISYSFSDSDQRVLNDVSLNIKYGETVAFVGSSGAGKSTLLDIMLGLLTPTEGQVRVGGRPIKSDLKGWYSSFGVVPQDVFLIDDTLKANIAFGLRDDQILAEKLDRAIQLAHLDEVIRNLPEGLDTRIGEKGSRLSGGQRQRLGIARALYLQPSFLILDEATSALDNETEHRVTNTITSLRGQMTIVLVAHRLSTVRDADRVIFLKDGRIAADGSFDEVRESNAEFAHLVALGKLD